MRKRLTRIFFIGFLSIIIILFALISLLRLPSIQQKIINYATTAYSEKTGGNISIEKIHLTYALSLRIENLNISTPEDETLLRWDNLELGVDFLPLLRKNVVLHIITLDGLFAEIKQFDEETFSFSFLIPKTDSPTEISDTSTTSESSSWTIHWNKIRLGKTQLSFIDAESSSYSLNFSKLFIHPKTIDGNTIDVSQVLISDPVIKIDRRTAINNANNQEPTQESESNLRIKVHKFNIQNLELHYQDKETTANIRWEDFIINLQELNLGDKRILVNELRLLELNSVIALTDGEEQTIESQNIQNDTEEEFEFPDWQITVAQFQFSASDVIVEKNKQSLLNLKHLDWHADSIFLNHPNGENLFGIQQKSLNLIAEDLPNIHQVQFNLIGNKQELILSKLFTEIESAQIKSSIHVKHEGLSQLIKNSNHAIWDLEIEADNLIPGEFVDSLPNWLGTKMYGLNTKLEGIGIENAVVKHFHLQQKDGLVLQLEGSGNQLTDTSSMNFKWNISDFKVYGDFWRSIKREYDIDIHQTYVQISSFGRYTPQSIDAKLSVNAKNISTQFNIQQVSEKFTINGLLDIGEIAENLPQLKGPFYLSLYPDWQKNTTFNFDIQKLVYQNQLIDSINILSSIDQGVFSGEIQILHPQANISLNANAEMPGNYFQDARGQFNLQINHFESSYFGLSNNYLRSSGNVRGALEFANDSNFSVNIYSDSLSIREENRSWEYNNLQLKVANNDSNSNALIDLQDFQATYSANQNFNGVRRELETYVHSLLDSLPEDSSAKPTEINLTMSLHTGFISSFINKDIQLGEDSLHFDLYYSNEGNSEFRGQLRCGSLNTQAAGLSNAGVFMEGQKGRAELNLRLDSIFAQEYQIGDILVNAGIDQGNLSLLFRNTKEGDIYINVENQITISNQKLGWHITPDSLILAGNKWSILPENHLHWENNFLQAKNWTLQFQDKEISLETKDKKDDRETDFYLTNFEIGGISGIFDDENPPVTGTIDGIIHWAQKGGVFGRVRIDKLAVLENPIANIDIIAQRNNEGLFDLDVEANGPNLSFTVDGQYYTDYLNLNLQLFRLDLALLEAFGGAVISNTKGHIALQANINQQNSDLLYKGSLQFKDASFIINALKAPFTLSNEEISLIDKRIQFQQFTLRDGDNNQLQVNGNVDLQNILRPEFALKIDAPVFRLLQSTREDNDLFFGDLLISAKIDIKGNTLVPIVRAETKFLKGTKVNFIVPESEANMLNRKSVVEIVDRSIPDSVRNQRQEIYLESGMELLAAIKADPQTTFRIIIDERAGDMLEITGGADLEFSLDLSGNMGLTGSYNITEGVYRLNFFDLVQRNFKIARGSSIRWNGDPLFATLDLQAIYALRTSPLELMIPQVGPNRDVQLPYRRDQPFEVQLNIKGELLQPEISFDLDMPENARGAVNGSIYNRIVQMREDENELNQQTFALIVLNQFVPTGQGGPGPGASELARSSASRMLSQQLNQLSDRFVKGIDLEVGLDSYTDHAAGEDRTDLNLRVGKAFMDDRLRVEVGGQFDVEGQKAAQGADQFMGDVSIEYQITEDGRYRLKAFRRNEWQGAVEGQIITTGASVLFKREFATFSELIKYLLYKNEEDEKK